MNALQQFLSYHLLTMISVLNYCSNLILVVVTSPLDLAEVVVVSNHCLKLVGFYSHV